MFNLLLALITGLVIGWNFHSFFMQLNPPNILKNDINISQISEEKLTQKKTIEEEKIINLVERVESPPSKEKVTLIKKAKVDPFYALLEKDLFSDAMALYLDAKNTLLPAYRTALLNYFKIKSTLNPNESIKKMLEFRELEPKHKAVTLLLIETYKKVKAHKKAIDLITQLTETASATEVESLHLNLISTSKSHVEELKASKNLLKLLSFLKERIEIGIKVPFYTYTLAQYYVNIQEYTLATQVLKELEYDEEYGEKAKNLLKEIEEKIVQNQEYTHQLVLNKVGEHFTITVHVNHEPLTLLLDTGATLTMVNEEKISSLTILKENITLNTVGGEIHAQLQEADTFSVGDIELEKFQIVTSPFEQKNADGLLGMNFFKRFKFKIDQEAGLLYLGKKTIE